MKVLIVNAPPLRTLGITGQIYPPLGILYLASYSREKRGDFEIQAIDGYREDTCNIVSKIIKYNPGVLGISFTTQAATGAYRLIDEVKERTTKIHVVVGGPHPTIIPEETFERSKADMVVVGEGEETFLEVLERVDTGGDLDSIMGTVVLENGKIRRNPPRPLIRDLDDIPFPGRDLLDIKKYPGYMYKKFSHDTDIISARGCPFNCFYCSNPIWKQQKPWYRLRSPKNVVDEIQHIVENYGIREIFDQTDVFNGSKKWAKDVCDEIIERNLDIAWKAQMRVDNVDGELADKLKKAGFWMGLFGLESSNDRTLDGIKKKQNLEQMNRALSIMNEKDIKCFGLFMAFNVWEEDGRLCYESKEDSLRTLEYVKMLIKEKKIHLFGWSMTTPYPGSELYDIAARHNLIEKEYVGNWEYFDSGANFPMKLPGVEEKDWLEVLNAGKKLQARLLFSSGTFNIKAMPLYMKKAYFVAKRNVQGLYNQFTSRRS
ncbi:MAG: B12-binding domain-containing radical SAM protein [Candidatus Hodarchaeota archaeon]